MQHHAHLQLLKQPPLRLHFHVPSDDGSAPYWTEDAGVALAVMAGQLIRRAEGTPSEAAALQLAQDYEDAFNSQRSHAERVLYAGVSFQPTLPDNRARELQAEVIACRRLDCMRYCPYAGCARAISITSDEHRCPMCNRYLVSWDACDWIDYTSSDAWKAKYDCLCSLAYDDWDFLPSLQHAQIIFRAWAVREEMPTLDRWADEPIGAPCDDLETALAEAQELRQRLAVNAESWPHEGEAAPQIAAVDAACRCLRSHLGDTLVAMLLNQARRDHFHLGRRIASELICAALAVVTVVVSAILAATTGLAGDIDIYALEIGCIVYIFAVIADASTAYIRKRNAQQTIRDLDRPRRQLGAPTTRSAT